MLMEGFKNIFKLMKTNKVLITGTAGFIGFHLVNHILKEKFEIVGLDNINGYYDVNLKLHNKLFKEGETNHYLKIMKASKTTNDF